MFSSFLKIQKKNERSDDRSRRNKMAIREIRIQGDSVLEKKCKEVKEVTPRIRELIDDML